MNPYVEEVHPSQLRRAMSVYNAAGVDVRGYRRLETGMMAIIIMLPEGDEAPDWRGVQPKRRPRRLPAFDWRRWVSALCVVAIIGAVGYIVYGAAMGNAGGDVLTLADIGVEVGGMKFDPVTGHVVEPSPLERAQQVADSALDWLRGLLPQQAQPQAGGWLPRNPIGDAVDGVTQTVAALTYAVIALGALAVLSLVAGIIGKFRR